MCVVCLRLGSCCLRATERKFSSFCAATHPVCPENSTKNVIQVFFKYLVDGADRWRDPPDYASHWLVLIEDLGEPLCYGGLQ